MEKLFKKQLENKRPISKQLLSLLNIKKYYSGEDIKIGDNVLYAILNKGISSNGIWDLELITLNENQFDLYCVDTTAAGTIIPTIKLKI